MQRITITIIASLVTAALFTPAWAEAPTGIDAALKQDVVLRALVDELDRNFTGLKLEDLERPYFIEYALADATGFSVSAVLGAVTDDSDYRARQLRATVRVGSYELDNTNFMGGGRGFPYGRGGGGGGGMAALPIEDNYEAIRQAIWWATDREYKDVVETLAQKKAFMESKLIEDKPPDFAPAEPAVHFDPPAQFDLHADQLKRLAIELSGVFREYPQVQDSSVGLTAGGGNKYLVNTEGTRLRIASTTYTLAIEATVQAEDGMELSDSIEIEVRKFTDLPSLAELTAKCRKLVDRLTQVRDAPILDAYTGPVLFDAEPATSLFAGQFAGRFSGGQRPVGSSTSPDDFENKLGQRILPRGVRVVDDPTREEIAGQPAMGHYRYDDEGVPAQAVTLVEGGKLQTLLMSRNPSKDFATSNGHGRGMFGPQASAGSLMLTADEGESEADLRAELLEAAADEGLDFALRVEALGSVGGGGGYGRYFRGGGGQTPLVMYKVYPDGKEEQVRGVQIARIDLRSFKDVLAFGDQLYVSNSGRGTQGRTVAAPAMLFEELDLAKIDEDFDKPPILPAPVARDH